MRLSVSLILRVGIQIKILDYSYCSLGEDKVFKSC